MKDAGDKNMNELITIETIENWLKIQVQEKQPISPGVWLDAAAKLNVLLQDLDEKLTEAEMLINEKTALFITAGDSVAKAKTVVKGLPEYREYLLLRAKKERIMEHIRIAKKRTELQNWSM